MKAPQNSTDTVRRLAVALCMAAATSIGAATAGCTTAQNHNTQTADTTRTLSDKKYLGGLTPDEALQYMKSTPNLCIIDVRTNEWYDGYTQFDGNIHIAHTELEKNLDRIPSDRPVILNCGMGMVAPRAYERLKKLDADVAQLSYIAGPPHFKDYNEWRQKQK